VGHAFSPSDDSPGLFTRSTQPKKAAAATAPSSPGMSFDTEAARAGKQAASQRDFTQYKQSQNNGSPGTPARSSSPGYTGPVPPVIPPSQRAPMNGNPNGGFPSSGGGNYGGGYGRASWYPEPQIYATRSIRLRNYYSPVYYSRPVVIYNDNYSSLFWWWLLDQSLDDRAYWVYHHRADMDDARYRALVYQDLELENRVQQLEQRQIAVDPNYVPPNMDRDLMYSDKYVDRAYATRPTHNGRIVFWFIMVPTAVGVGGFLVWLVFFKRFQTAQA
jgi:hypothetical protein